MSHNETDRNIHQSISEEMRLNEMVGELIEQTVTLRVSSGKVIFSGTVSSEEERRELMRIARYTPGVTVVRDELTVAGPEAIDRQGGPGSDGRSA